ncbi:MAG: DUF3786 domain-containing protein [Nitrospirae bacterium]|nr:MAG: DUF3786 domain-containing protein [Nitrospirota bacterium]
MSLELVPLKTVHGEEKVWNLISELSPVDICARAGVTCDQGGKIFTVRSFGIDFRLSASQRSISSDSPLASLFLEQLKDFFRLPMLWYLTSAKDIPCTNRLIKPIDVKGGQRFFSGTHVLPLDKLAEKYGKDKELFLRKGAELGAEVVGHGDAALRFYPLPNVPITLILWLEDEEFPARVDLLFDSTCDLQIALSDIIWSLATLTALVMLH